MPAARVFYLLALTTFLGMVGPVADGHHGVVFVAPRRGSDRGAGFRW